MKISPNPTQRLQRREAPARPAQRLVLPAVCLVLLWALSAAAAPPPVVRLDQQGKLVYTPDPQGNTLPDFSFCGFGAGSKAIPNVDVRIVVAPDEGDDTGRIQAAIDYVAGLPVDEDGWRGAVLLAAGEYQVESQLRVAVSGVVLRGSGSGRVGTTLRATGLGRRTLIEVGPSPTDNARDDANVPDEDATAVPVTAPYVPVGSRQLPVQSAANFDVGETIRVTRPATSQWIARLGMDEFGLGWRAGSRDVTWERTILGKDGDTLVLDAPLTVALESRYGGAVVRRGPGVARLAHIGIESLRLVSDHADDNTSDEDHAWLGVHLDRVEHAWVRRLQCFHFAGGAVHLGSATKWITVSDCVSSGPVSEIAGYRRHTFFTAGQMTLFLGCGSVAGRHDFSVGHCAAGPNAFVCCYAERALADSGPLESWASGVLYDNVRIDGGGLSLTNRWATPPAAGWAAANCLLWQCRADTAECFSPPTATNWCIGTWATFVGDGVFEGRNDFVAPASLYRQQLRERAGAATSQSVELLFDENESATNPTFEQAAAFVARSGGPAEPVIRRLRRRAARVVAARNTPLASPRPAQLPAAPLASEIGAGLVQDRLLSVQNGWLLVGDQLQTGPVYRPLWWQGTLCPTKAPQLGPNVTRFAPGRVGTGLTDDLAEVVRALVANHTSLYEHHYGLWYDRRRDDHLIGRRASGDVAPPFYEQPFARSGRGTAWDGLSKYDLEKFNPWYWQRLRDMGQLCDRHGLIFAHQHYFQHNILEAGAHWVDSPWRPANNINDTRLPEPPQLIGDKRIFMAHHFYDLSDPSRRRLHRNYIRQCLDNAAGLDNVIHLTSAEYTGPVEFVQFWLDTIIQWQQETQREVTVALSCPRNVQDAILADPSREPAVDLIDIRYWTYMEDGNLYAPPGGMNLAPRQFQRQLKPLPTSFDSIARAVREMRSRFPEKGILYNADAACRSGRDGWAVLIGGGSLPDIAALPPELATMMPTLRPDEVTVPAGQGWCLSRPGRDYLVYIKPGNDSLTLDLSRHPGRYQVNWIDPDSLAISAARIINGQSPSELTVAGSVAWLHHVDDAVAARGDIRAADN